MKVNRKLTQAEKSKAMFELMKPFNQFDRMTFALGGGMANFHDLNVITRPLMQKYGIEFSWVKDFEVSNEVNKFAYELKNKNNKYKGGISNECFRLARFFMQLADTAEIIERAAE